MPNYYPKLNFPSINLRAQRQNDSDTLMVWSSPRNCYLVLTPEEWVRRHLVEYLVGLYHITQKQIIEEYPVSINGQPQRADVVVMKGSKPIILAECKAPDIKLSHNTLTQARRYNSIVEAKYRILTNGIKHLCFKKNENGEYLTIDSFRVL